MRRIIAVFGLVFLMSLIPSPIFAQNTPDATRYQVYLPAVQDSVYPTEVQLNETTLVYDDVGHFVCVDACSPPDRLEAGDRLYVHSVHYVLFVIPFGYNVSRVGQTDEIDYTRDKTW